MHTLHKTRWIRNGFALAVALILSMPTGPSYATQAASDVATHAPQTADAPDGLVIRKIVANENNFCFLTQAGSVYCWGNSVLGLGSYGQQPTLVQGAANGITDLALGDGHACVLSSSGGVRCWGSNGQGQLGNAATAYRTQVLTDVVGLSSGVVAIAAGGNTSCAIKTGGALYCWGNNEYGQLGIGSTQNMSVPVMVSGTLSNVTTIATGDHTCAVTTTGSAWCWGSNQFGELGDDTTTTKNTPVPVSGLSSGVLTIDTGDTSTCALVTGGGVKCWGYFTFIGNGLHTPKDVAGITSGVAQLSVGSDHACVQLTDGSAKCWGRNDAGQLGDGTLTASSTPVSLVGVSNITQVAAGGSTFFGMSCAVMGGNAIKCWGYNADGNLGNGEVVYRTTPLEVPGLTGVIGLGLGEQHTCAIVNPGIVKCWGGNMAGSLGDNRGKYGLTPTTVSLSKPLVSPEGVTQIDTSYGTNCTLAVNTLTCWGDGTPNLITLPSVPTQISTYLHTCVLIGGGVKCIGSNAVGQLGDGTTTTNRNTWVDAIGLTSGVAKVSTGGRTTCALLISGGVKCWGSEVGDGTKTNRSTPTDVTGLSGGVVDIAVGGGHVCVAMADGSVKCWGSNRYGQIGVEPINFFDYRTAPTTASGLSGITKLSAGEEHTCALSSAGGVKCWGVNNYGSLGNGTVSESGRPGDVVGLTTGVASVVAGRGGIGYPNHTCAIMTNGTVRCWGYDHWGQVGDQRLGFALTPTNVLLNGVSSAGGDVTPTDSNGNTTFSFAGNTFTSSIVLSYSVPATVPPLGNLLGVNRVFDVTPLYADSGLPATPTGRYTTTVTYAEADLGGAAEGSLGLYFWDGSAWVLEPSSSVNAAANTVSASPNHFSTWAVLSNPQASNKKYVYLPMITK